MSVSIESIGNPCPAETSQLRLVHVSSPKQESSWGEYELSDLLTVILLFYLYIYFTYINKCAIFGALTLNRIMGCVIKWKPPHLDNYEAG